MNGLSNLPVKVSGRRAAWMGSGGVLAKQRKRLKSSEWQGISTW